MASIMKNANRLQKALRTDSGASFGAWQMLPGGNLSRVIARAGFDWVCVDCEHGNVAGIVPPLQPQAISNIRTPDHQMHESVAAIASCGASPLVRIPANEGWMVKRALDSGAHGIVVPLLYTADDARTLVQSAKFPPVGRRGYGSPFTMGSFAAEGDLSGLEYLQNANESLLTIVQIETKEAFQNLDEIAKVEGIDVLFIGPWDLGNNLGYPVTGDFAPELKAAIAKILEVAKANGRKAGIYTTGGEMARMYADQGFHMVSVVADMVALPTFMSQSLTLAKGEKAGSGAIRGAAYGTGK